MCPAADGPEADLPSFAIVNCAEQAVQTMNEQSIPAVEMRNKIRRPSLSTMKHIPKATMKFTIWRIPLISNWVLESVIPMSPSTMKM